MELLWISLLVFNGCVLANADMCVPASCMPPGGMPTSCMPQQCKQQCYVFNVPCMVCCPDPSKVTITPYCEYSTTRQCHNLFSPCYPSTTPGTAPGQGGTVPDGTGTGGGAAGGGTAPPNGDNVGAAAGGNNSTVGVAQGNTGAGAGPANVYNAGPGSTGGMMGEVHNSTIYVGNANNTKSQP